MSTIQSLAREMSEAFETDTRDDGSKFVKLRDGRPKWMQDVSFKAHGDMLPDDWRYQFIREAVDALAEHEDEDAARESACEPSIYTSDLTGWLNSRNDRAGYCDQYMEDFAPEEFPGTTKLLQQGQWMEREEVFGLVLNALRDLADDGDTEDEDYDLIPGDRKPGIFDE